jgi:hypothetical protein
MSKILFIPFRLSRRAAGRAVMGSAGSGAELDPTPLGGR